ncbi:MAG: STAS domain-containing protein [Clostridia bacterium]|nr:STAS domain-containing protein [Clostridia bacterium]MBQ5833879.1 STAS domain-containing protein [Clostridia bacterium]
MKVDFTNNNGVLTVALDGRLDTTTAPELEKLLCENCANATALILDCEKLVYISSAGLRVLLTNQKKMKGAMKLIHVCELVMEVFEMTGFADILVIE